MQVKLITEKSIWESFVLSQAEYTFLHSWNWGVFSLAMGHKIFRLGVYDGDELVGVALVVGINAKRGKFLFVPHGPIIAQNSKLFNCNAITRSEATDWKTQNDNAKLKTIIDFLRNLAKEEKCSFIRMSPLLERNEQNEKLFQELGFRKAPIHMHAESTLLLDITKPEEELLKNMRKTTRYLIKKMEKEGVEIEIENPPTGQDFLRLQKEVAKRKHFVVFSQKQIKKEIDIFCPNGEIAVFNARYQNEVVASALIVFYGYRAFYYQSASYCKNKDISAPYLLVWRAIQEAKRRGCSIFDFYGASPQDKPGHPWAGPTLFKSGFGTERIDYLPAQDLPLNWKYSGTWLLETLRRIKRGF